MSMTINISEKLVYFGIGLAGGLLLSSESGRDFRNRLVTRGQEMKDSIVNRVQESGGVGGAASSTLHNVVERGRNIANIGRQRINESVEAGVQKFNESIEGGERERASR
jgi:hypothetical protein